MTGIKIDLEGRQLVDTIVNEQTPSKIIRTSIYNDGTEVTTIHEAGEVSVSSNRTIQIQPDGKTVKLV